MHSKQLPGLTDMIATLVSTPSVSSVNPQFDMSNRAVCEILANWFDDLGCQVDLMKIPGDRDQFNVAARFGEGPPGLALCGHTDTVPFDEDRWSVDPLAARVIDGKLFGIGSADMKGFLALGAKVAETLDAKKLNRSILFLGSADEESSMEGARHLCDIDYQMPPYCVVGEPTGLQPIHQHKGMMMERVILNGKSGHSSNPDLGINAIDGMAEVISLLDKFRQQIQQEFHDENFIVPYPTLNFGHIEGGDNPNRICGQCTLDFDLRLMPGMNVPATRRRLHEYLHKGLTGSALQLEFETLFKGTDPLSGNASSRLIKACEHHSGQHAGSVDFCTEGPFYQSLGAETVIMGPGNIEVAHQPDEFLSLDALPEMQGILEHLIQNFCVES